jgi:uncharacterized integral membrane protein (TIGR00697 family)
MSQTSPPEPLGGAGNPVIATMLGVHVTLLVAGLAGGGKVIAVGPFAASATVFLYACSFVMTDLVNELYGGKLAKRFVSVGFVAVFVALGCYQLVARVPAVEGFAAAPAYEAVFGATPRLVVAGMAAYLASQYLDVWLFSRIRAWTGERHLWLRNNGSTILTQLLDTSVFIVIGFAGVVPELWKMIAGQILIKSVISVAYTPLVYAVVAWQKRRRATLPASAVSDQPQPQPGS